MIWEPSVPRAREEHARLGAGLRERRMGPSAGRPQAFMHSNRSSTVEELPYQAGAGRWVRPDPITDRLVVVGSEALDHGVDNGRAKHTVALEDITVRLQLRGGVETGCGKLVQRH